MSGLLLLLLIRQLLLERYILPVFLAAHVHLYISAGMVDRPPIFANVVLSVLENRPTAYADRASHFARSFVPPTTYLCTIDQR